MFSSRKKNTNIKDFPEEILLNVFSFFRRPQASLSLVCNSWNRVWNDKTLWRSYIKDEFLEELNESNLSAKEFYKKNEYARREFIRTVYTIASPLGFKACDDTINCNWLERVINTNNTHNTLMRLITAIKEGKDIYINQKQLNMLLNWNNKDYIPAFTTLNEAVKCANKLYNLHELSTLYMKHPRHPLGTQFSYPVIFRIDVINFDKLSKTKEVYFFPKKLLKFYCNPIHKLEHSFSCFHIKKSDLRKPHNAYSQHSNHRLRTSRLILEELEPSIEPSNTYRIS
jgi:F-box-like